MLPVRSVFFFVYFHNWCRSVAAPVPTEDAICGVWNLGYMKFIVSMSIANFRWKYMPKSYLKLLQRSLCFADASPTKQMQGGCESTDRQMNISVLACERFVVQERIMLIKWRCCAECRLFTIWMETARKCALCSNTSRKLHLARQRFIPIKDPASRFWVFGWMAGGWGGEILHPPPRLTREPVALAMGARPRLRVIFKGLKTIFKFQCLIKG